MLSRAKKLAHVVLTPIPSSLLQELHLVGYALHWNWPVSLTKHSSTVKLHIYEPVTLAHTYLNTSLAEQHFLDQPHTSTDFGKW